MKINWNKFSAKVQAHGMCRYCDEYAEYMNQRSDGGGYDAVCEKHHHDNKEKDNYEKNC